MKRIVVKTDRQNNRWYVYDVETLIEVITTNVFDAFKLADTLKKEKNYKTRTLVTAYEKA